MDPVTALKAGRLAAQATFIDTYKVERPGEPVTDPDTGVVSPGLTLIWTGKGKVQVNAPAASTPLAGSHEFTVQSMSLHLPVNAGPFGIGDVATVVASPLDPGRIGNKLRITALFDKTYATAQRLKVEQVTG
ncbi:DUF6093 family protein [Pseudarthrobacter sp. J1738]|uniref:DUF6093 family protein n=1 Tax=Pseudarthrobacter sp. J1738 TaxID=3420446 RepID=UPI003D2B491A